MFFCLVTILIFKSFMSDNSTAAHLSWLVFAWCNLSTLLLSTYLFFFLPVCFIHVDLSYCLIVQFQWRDITCRSASDKFFFQFFMIWICLSFSFTFEGYFYFICNSWLTIFFFHHFGWKWNMSSHCLLAFMVCNEKLAINLIEDLLYVINCFSCWFQYFF